MHCAPCIKDTSVFPGTNYHLIETVKIVSVSDLNLKNWRFFFLAKAFTVDNDSNEIGSP